MLPAASAKRRTGRRERHMRYVVVITAIAFFVIWDGLYNQGIYLDRFIQSLSYGLRWIGF
jgi:hypothetical protein